MEIVVAIAAKIAEYTVAPVGRQIGYVILYDRNTHNLKTQVQKLEEAKVVVQHSADAAVRNGEEIEASVQRWLKKVDDIVAESQRIFHDNVGCSNMLLKHQLSRRAKKMLPVMTEILEEGNFSKISYRPHLPMAVTASARGYEALESRASMLREIMRVLKDESMFLIGLYGMGGVGKTTLVKELAWQAEQERTFGAVVLATVSNSPDVKKIQGQIADGLGLKFDEETEIGRASRLRQRMKKENKILVILDDIWETLDLIEVGIPFGEDHRGCKLLLTSRNLDVLQNKMDAQKEFRLEALSEGESWRLFEKLGGNVVNDMNLQPIALEVAKSCGGLPLLIANVAKTLKNKEVYVWKDALNQLARFEDDELGKKVRCAVEMSYNYLPSDEHRSFFLFIASYGNDSHVEDLLICGWSLGLYKGVGTLADARNRVYKLAKDLRASCLLLEGENDWVQMHDVIYDVASSIASTIEPFFAMQRYRELKQWPNMDLLKRCRGIYLPWCHIKELSEQLECPELKILVLNSKDNYLKVPDNFFDGMRELKVLDFAGFDCCPSTPPSLSHLTNLRALYLYQCMLGDITAVAELTNLEILSLMNSEIKELPAALAQLTHLRMLNLTHCSALTTIPANLLSSLKCLEELYMGNCFIQWEAEGSHSQSNNASLGELRHLHKLTTLNLQIQDACILPKDLRIFGQLQSYKIVIGDNFEWSWVYYDESQKTSRTLKLSFSTTTNIHLDHGIKMLLNSVEDLYLANLKGVENVLYQLNGEGFPQLKHLSIQNSDELQFIIDSTEWVHSRPAFPNLESLVLHNLTNLEKLCHGPFSMQSLAKLKVIKITGCGRLRNLTVYEMLRDLPQLAEVEISQCTCMTEIIVQHDKETDKIMLPKLQSLTLDCLPMLGRLYSKLLTVDAQFENHVVESKDVSYMAMPLFDEKIVFPNLESLRLSSVNLRTIWDDQLSTHSCVQNLTSLTIDNCDCLKYVFSSPVARELVKLQYLKISRCKMLEEIFVPPENLLLNEEATFPRLTTLVISHMDSLKSVWKTHLAPKSFGKLNNMEIAFCKKLLTVVPCNVLNLLLNLETMLITNCDALEVVFENQELSTSGTQRGTPATKLRALTLEYLPVLNHVFPLSLAKEPLELQVLDIRCCGVQNIVANDGMAEAASTLVFPKLTSLTLLILPELRGFYSGLHFLDCPCLRVLQVYHCSKLQLFTYQSQNYRVQMDVPLFSFEKVIPNIEDLTLSSEDVTMICNTQLRDDYFYKVKDLCLLCFHNESDEFPSGFLQKFENLQNLQLSCSSFVEIFLSESLDIAHPQKSIKLKSLILDNLKNLEYLFKDSQMQQILQNLETLEVHACPRLKNVIPSSVLFQNLQALSVGEYAGLVNLVVSSSARSFLNLKTLMIHHCKMIEEIVNSEEGDTGDITFMKLEHLQLCGLPMLTSFCKGHQNFKFPLLRTIFVVECPMMETFSRGMLSTPTLGSVKLTDEGDVWSWKGDLNTTITTIFRKKISQED